MVVFLDENKIFSIKYFKLENNKIITEYGGININPNTTATSVYGKIQTAIRNGDKYIDLRNDTNINYGEFAENFINTAEELMSITISRQDEEFVNNESWHIKGNNIITKRGVKPFFITIDEIKSQLDKHPQFLDLSL